MTSTAPSRASGITGVPVLGRPPAGGLVDGGPLVGGPLVGGGVVLGGVVAMLHGPVPLPSSSSGCSGSRDTVRPSGGGETGEGLAERPVAAHAPQPG